MIATITGTTRPLVGVTDRQLDTSRHSGTVRPSDRSSTFAGSVVFNSGIAVCVRSTAAAATAAVAGARLQTVAMAAAAAAVSAQHHPLPRR